MQNKSRTNRTETGKFLNVSGLLQNMPEAEPPAALLAQIVAATISRRARASKTKKSLPAMRPAAL